MRETRRVALAAERGEGGGALPPRALGVLVPGVEGRLDRRAARVRVAELDRRELQGARTQQPSSAGDALRCVASQPCGLFVMYGRATARGTR